MSLGYIKGKYWVPDDVYHAWVDRETYKALLKALFQAQVGFDCRYSYTAQRYTAEVLTYEQINGRWYRMGHNLAYDAHPMTAVTKALRGYDHGNPLIHVLCLELDCMVLGEKLLPMKKLEDALEKLADTIVLGKM